MVIFLLIPLIHSFLRAELCPVLGVALAEDGWVGSHDLGIVEWAVPGSTLNPKSETLNPAP